MNKRLVPLLPICLLLAPLALSACGGGEDAGEVEAIADTIAAVVTGDDPSKCTELMTQDFVEQQNANATGAAAVEECEAEAPNTEDDADEVTVAAVSIEAGAAEAEVGFVGGGFDGQTVAVELVEDEGRWKLDRIAGFVSYDAEALAKTLEERFAAASSRITPAQLACIGDGIREASEARVEAMLLSGDPREFIEFAESCE